MTISWNDIVWHQFAAAIDDLDNNLRACPDSLWHEPLWPPPPHLPEFSHFWYVVYHTLFWLDLYLTGAEEGFVPPPPFALIEQVDLGPLPPRPYTRDELHAYLGDVRQRCRMTLETMTPTAAARRCRFAWGEVSFAELLLYTMRHVQGHAAQLNLFLGQHNIAVDDWVTGAGDEA